MIEIPPISPEVIDAYTAFGEALNVALWVVNLLLWVIR